MQTPIITDIVAVAVPATGATALDATVSLKLLDAAGDHVGTAAVDPATLRDAAYKLLAMAEATILHAAAPGTHAAPPRARIQMVAEPIRPGIVMRRLVEALAA